MFKRFLLPVDGSELSSRAVATGIALAASLGAEIHALHVLPSTPAAEAFAVIAQADECASRERDIAYAERMLHDVCERARVAGVPCTASHVVERRTACAIEAALTKYHCDLIVMATHGSRGMERLLLGSVTQEVLLMASVPVMVCR